MRIVVNKNSGGCHAFQLASGVGYNTRTVKNSLRIDKYDRGNRIENAYNGLKVRWQTAAP